MGIGTADNFKIYNEYIQTGYVETLTQVSEVFNQASNGAIRLTGVTRRGEFTYESFWPVVDDLIQRRVNKGSAATAAVTDTPLAQAEMSTVKVNRRIGPVAQTLDAFKKIAKGPFNLNAMDFAIGVQSAKAAQVEQCNTALRALRAALVTQAATVGYTIPSSGTMTTVGLVNGLSKYGDAASRIAIWVMHSKVYFDLVKEQIALNMTGVSGINVAQGTPLTLNRPVLVVDSPALATTSGSPAVTTYYTLGLTVGALVIEDSEEETIWRDPVTGLENLVIRFQGEYAYNIGMKGFSWDVTNGGANPTDSALGTGSNWDPVYDSYKDWPGVVIQSR